MNRIDQLINELENMSSNDTLMDKIVYCACWAAVAAVVVLVATGN